MVEKRRTTTKRGVPDVECSLDTRSIEGDGGVQIELDVYKSRAKSANMDGGAPNQQTSAHPSRGVLNNGKLS